MPDTAWKWLLAVLGMASILFGVLALLGRRPLGDPATTTVIALGAVLNGAVVTRLAFGRDRTP
jgi:hypothetical protein